MSDPAAEFFQELGERGHEPLLHRANGTLRYDHSAGSKKATWLVAMDAGDVTVSRKNAKADCVVRAEKTLVDQIVLGRANAMAAMLRGVIGIDGNLELLMLFQRLFPGPPSARGHAGIGSGKGRT